uniref:Secreted protein n=1 Tax=Setaria viridis TaxID=4556 RepID=A0A4U6V711_SETVI|nr:hypothetical protein SEVIR_3G089066v2 [Setaria viridis]
MSVIGFCLCCGCWLACCLLLSLFHFSIPPDGLGFPCGKLPSVPPLSSPVPATCSVLAASDQIWVQRCYYSSLEWAARICVLFSIFLAKTCDNTY